LPTRRLESIHASAHFAGVRSPVLWLFAALLLTACSRRNPDAKAQAIAEASRHISAGADLVTRISKLTELTPSYEVSGTLRRFTHDVQEWARAYATQRAKLVARGISREESTELTRRYKATVEDLKTKVEQTERRLSKRSDNKLYYAELLRMREAMRQL
jgi:hypothetical protein